MFQKLCLDTAIDSLSTQFEQMCITDACTPTHSFSELRWL